MKLTFGIEAIFSMHQILLRLQVTVDNHQNKSRTPTEPVKTGPKKISKMVGYTLKALK
jgi:hypothetical protein